MKDARFSDTLSIDWTPDTRFDGIFVKVIETRDTHPAFSMMRVRVDPGKSIPTHTHPTETETAFIVSGEGVFRHGEQETRLTTGMVVTIPPGLPHSLHNTSSAPIEIMAMHTPPVR